MPRRGPRRSATEWGVRGALALAAAVVGYVGTTHSLAQVIVERDPARAHALAPWDGRITAHLAEQRFLDNPAGGAQTPAAQLARRALRQDPTAVSAVATLGLQAQLRGDAAQARQVFGYAQRLSRRDLQTQLWAIEDAVVRGDIPGALRHYDIALRTSRRAPDLLFPVLASAIADPAIRANLVPTLAPQPIWGAGFIGYVAGNSDDPRAVADLLAGLQRADVPVSSEASATAINRLIAADAFDDAWRYYAASRDDVARTRSRDPRFTADLPVPSAFDWVPVNDTGVATSIQRGEKGGIVDFSAPPSVGGTVVRQLQLLPAGTYRLQGSSVGIEQPSGSQPYWVLACRNGRELGRVAVPNSAEGNGVFTGRFSVPADCAVQTLSLVVRPSSEITGVAGQIERAELVPAG